MDADPEALIAATKAWARQVDLDGDYSDTEEIYDLVDRLLAALEASRLRVGELEVALSEIDDECSNEGYPNEIVATRMIERIQETARAALEADHAD